jgi:ABC-type histidine transport system ATPase subunit
MEFARDVANRIVVIPDGELVEQGAPADLLNHPQDVHTQALLERYRAGKSPQPDA